MSTGAMLPDCNTRTASGSSSRNAAMNSPRVAGVCGRQAAAGKPTRWKTPARWNRGYAGDSDRVTLCAKAKWR